MKTFELTFDENENNRIESIIITDKPSKLRGDRRDILYINECNNISFESYNELAIRNGIGFTTFNKNIMRIRASQLGKIMTSPKTKGEVLSKTCKTYIQELAIENTYGIRKEFWSRYTDKGNECEDEAIELVNDVLNLGFIYKNEENLTNEWITGTPDVNTNEILIDVKTSWDATTFPFFEDEIPNKDYYFQLQGYLWLTGKDEALLCYCLVNTPFQIVEDEVRREHWKQGLIDESLDVRDFVQKKHNFDHIPKEKRVKTFKIAKDEEIIEKIKQRVEECREYYNNLLINL